MRYLVFLVLGALWLIGLSVYQPLLFFLVPYTLMGLFCALWLNRTVAAMAALEYRSRLWGILSERDLQKVDDTLDNNRFKIVASLVFLPILSFCGFLESFMLESG